MLALKTIYPQKFPLVYSTDETRNAAIKLWGKWLADVADAHVQRALGDCVAKFVWPPELPEFLALCKSYGGSNRYSAGSAINVNERVTLSENRILVNKMTPITSRIMRLYPGKKCMQVSDILSKIMREARKFFPNCDESQLCDEVIKFSDEDFYDICPREI